MNTRNEIKITFGTPKYLIYGNFTKCNLPFTVKLPPIMETLMNTFIDKGYLEKFPKYVKGMATVFAGDEYDETTGIKVATAKAEIAAYTLVSNKLMDLYSLIIDNLHYKVDDFLIKAEKVIKHDKQYVDRF